MSVVVHLPDELARRLEAAAAQRGVSPDELAAEVLDAHVPGQRHFSFAGVGASGQTDVSERHEEIIRESYRRKTSEDV